MALLDPILMFEAASATAWPHETKFVKVLNLIGGDPSYNELTHTLTVTLGGGEGGAELVTYTNEGTANQFVKSELRLFGSDGTTAGGEWSVKSKAFLDSALADNSIDLGKLHGGSASNNQVLRFSTSTGKWAPSNERVASVTGSGIATVTNPSGDVYNVHVPAPSYPSVPTYYAGAGMTADGTTFNVIAENGSIVVNADSLRVGFDATTPLANGVAAHGDSIYPAAANHVHPAAADSNTIVRYDPVHAIVYDMTISAPGRPVDGLYTDARVWYQNGSPYDGIYLWKGEAVPAVRAADMPDGAVLDLTKTHLIPVSNSQESGSESAFVFSNTTIGTVTVGTGNTGWSITGQDQNGKQLVHHLPCYCAATRDVPDLSNFPNDGTLFDGYIVSHGMRVLLPKQTSDVTTRGIYRVVYSASPAVNWSLSRDFDLDSGSVLRPNGYVVHHVNVLNGNLWGGPTRWAFWGGTVGAAVESGGVFSLVNLDGVDVIDTTVPAAGEYTFSPSGASSTTRYNMVIRGIVYTGSAVSEQPTKTTQLLPIDTEPPTDDLGVTWSGDNGSQTLTREYHTRNGGYPGHYSWNLNPAGTTSENRSIKRGITVPAYCRCKVTAWISSYTGGRVSGVRLGTASDADAYGSLNSDGSWQKFTSDEVPASSSTQAIYLEMWIRTGTLYFEEIQIDFIPDGAISTCLQINQEWAPDTITPVYLAGDESETQLVDPIAAWGNEKMFAPSMSSSCVWSLNHLHVERTLKLSVQTTHAGPAMTDPALPAITWPSQVYT